jgi:hypothetical protein
MPRLVNLLGVEWSTVALDSALIETLAVETLLVSLVVILMWWIWWAIADLRQSPREWSRARGWVGVSIVVAVGAFGLATAALEKVWFVGLAALSPTWLTSQLRDIATFLFWTVVGSIEFAIVRWLWHRMWRKMNPFALSMWERLERRRRRLHGDTLRDTNGQ